MYTANIFGKCKQCGNILIALAIVLLIPLSITGAWTDLPSFWPGSVVTIQGGNSHGTSYQQGETVHVEVWGPGTYHKICVDPFTNSDPIVGFSDSWTCQVTLGSGIKAVGDYYYIAIGASSGVVEYGS